MPGGDLLKSKGSCRALLPLVLLLLAGLSVLCYPGVSSWWNGRIQTRAVQDYDHSVAGLGEEEYDALFAAARAYNEALAEAGALRPSDEDPDYGGVLDITGTGIMGYLTIEKIGVELPIYHGTDAAALSAGAGHLEGSSLPVGGESTHAVISGHTGLPSARMFTDLDRMEVGDTFTITVLNRTLVYEVDQIKIVLPEQVEDLQIEKGEDYVTLVTCTPYGINDHRLLVRGVRIPEEREATQMLRDSLSSPDLFPAAVAASALWQGAELLFRRRRRQKSGG